MPTREELCQIHSLSDEQVKERLRAARLRVKKHYSDREGQRFTEALQMLGQGQTLQQVTEYFTALDENNKDPLTKLDEAAMKAGVELGDRQADIIASVIPKATMLRLEQKINSGEIENEFKRLWNELGAVGKPVDLEAEVVEYWNRTHLSSSKSQMSLPESSTELSDSDS